VEAGTAEDIFYRCRHPYTEALQRSVPRLSDDRKTRLLAIEGNPPNPSHLPPGCAFAPRCPYRLEDCDKAVPPLEPVGGIHTKACIYEGKLRYAIEVPA
jgi:oligopeptide/dipeptide ABC transporter ATP-binding protein